MTGPPRSIGVTILLLFAILQPVPLHAADRTEGGRSTQPMSMQQLQSEIMSFADRFGAVLWQAYEDFESQGPAQRARNIALGDTVYSMSSAFVIASNPNPSVALLDMIVLSALGRMIYEEHYLREFGKPAEAMAQGFRLLESDIGRIGEKVLTTSEREELYGLIRGWRQAHPEQLTFVYLRFSDFASERGKSTIAETVKSGGMFASVRGATKEIEQTRLLAERGIFLASRMPLLTGYFADFWVSHLASNPDAEKILKDLNRLSLASHRLADVGARLPDQIANLIKDLESQEERLHAMLADLRETMRLGSDVASSVQTTVQSADSLVTRVFPEGTTIENYEAVATKVMEAAQQLDKVINSAERLMASSHWDQTLPPVVKIVDKVESETEKLVTHVFLCGVALIVIFFLAMLGYRYAAMKLGEADK
jgi:hypothetical protein